MLVGIEQCADFDACARCFPPPVHPRHLFVRIPAQGTGDPDVVLNGMPHSICDGCGVGWGGQSWLCERSRLSSLKFF